MVWVEDVDEDEDEEVESDRACEDDSNGDEAGDIVVEVWDGIAVPVPVTLALALKPSSRDGSSPDSEPGADPDPNSKLDRGLTGGLNFSGLLLTAAPKLKRSSNTAVVALLFVFKPDSHVVAPPVFGGDGDGVNVVESDGVGSDGVAGEGRRAAGTGNAE